MSKITLVKGKPHSVNATEIVLNGGEQYIFGIQDLYDEKDENTLDWKIYKADGGLLKEKSGKWNEKLICDIGKKLCGDYRYQLEATIKQPDGTVVSTEKILLGGYCLPKILSYKTNIPETIKPEFGIDAEFEIEAEGLNGNVIIPELWFSDSNYIGYATSAKCIEGKAQSKITYFWAKLPKCDLPKFDRFKVSKSHPYSLLDIDLPNSSTTNKRLETKAIPALLSIKMKDVAGSCIKESDDKDFILNLKIISEPKVTNMTPLPSFPSNKTNATVKQAEAVDMEVNGIIDLTKIKIETKFDICSDEVIDFNDYGNFWILKDGKEYYHWLKKPDKADVDDIIDATTGAITKYAKLSKLNNIIPITLHSKQEFKFTATFDVILPIKSDEIEIRVNKKDEKDSTKYQFKTKMISSGALSKGDELVVECTANNKPYEDTIQYFEKFELFFEYSLDGKTWIPLKKVYFTLYLTWDEPLWGEFDKLCSMKSGTTLFDLGYPEEKTLNVSCKGNTNKKCLLESLLFISCKNNKVTKATEEKVVNGIFDMISSSPLRVFRARNSIEPLGYWRCSSALKPNKFTPTRSESFGLSRCERFMLRVGDGRCGEWAQFFINLCQTHGIKTEKIQHLAFVFDNKRYKADNSYSTNVFLVKKWTISDPKRPVDNGGKAQGNNKPLNIFSDHVFVVYNGIYYDPSYGLKGKTKHSSWKDVLKEYCPNALEGILFSKVDNLNGEAFYDNIHTEEYMDPQKSAYKTYPYESSVNKYIYINSVTDMESYFKEAY